MTTAALTTGPDSALADDLATACRILAGEGHEHFFLGHVSARLPDGPGLCLIKRTGIGLGDVTTEDLLVVDAERAVLAGVGSLHHETPIHTEIYRHRPDVGCVVHTHPPHAVAFSATDAPLRIVSQDSIPFRDGVPRFPDPRLVVTPDRGTALALALGPRAAVIMANHGLTVAGPDVRHAIFLAVSLERSLATQAAAGRLGAPCDIPDDVAREMADYFDHHYRGRVESVWDALARRHVPGRAAETGHAR